MKLGYDLNIEHIQKLVMTPELIQAIQILQFNSQELESFIEEQILTNPILETEISEPEHGEKNGDQEDMGNEADEIQDQPLASEKNDVDWSEYFKDQYDDISYKQEYNSDREDYSYEYMMPSDVTLTEHLMFQLQFAAQTHEQKTIGRYFIESLDQNGYVTITCKEVAEEFQVSEAEALEVLKLIQSFEPAGVGARDLKECLVIQVKMNSEPDSIAEKIIMNHLEDIAKNKIACIAKALNITLKETQEALDDIKRLEPKPGRQFSSAYEVKYIIPDVTVEKVDNKYVVIVNDSTTPKLNISPYYKEMLINSDKESAHSKFLTGRLNSAMWLIKSIEQRRQTIFNVVTAVVEYQQGFLKYGKKYLKPLTLKQVAEEVGIHESTVSRAISGKYMQCPRGVYEIKYFFTSGVSGMMGQGIASESIKTYIKELIDEEKSESPISDQVIADALGENGIEISRRTVAKYREEMHIPSSSKRRRY